MSDAFGDALRRATGRPVALDEKQAQDELSVGDVGIGKGGAAVPRRVRDDVAQTFNRELRLSAGHVKSNARINDLFGGSWS